MNDKSDELKPGPAHSGKSIRISKKTLYSWRKSTAAEIEYFIKTREDFYNFFLRNLN